MQIVGTATPPAPSTIAVLRSKDAYVQAIEVFLDDYRAAGVRDARIERLDL